MGLCDYGCYFEFRVLRCQPLNRALCLISITNRHCFYIQQYMFGYHIEL
ncbi:superoxide dismutase [Vibrio qinghaiensis]|uniref:Superoxide dismutase n=1 Tax=Vibrio qinghaiensis TaxID=2025808 RepID=A0A223N3W1_9VIBR|nr:superoxide dismutase [Vibrio qinghaiensis]